MVIKHIIYIYIFPKNLPLFLFFLGGGALPNPPSTSQVPGPPDSDGTFETATPQAFFWAMGWMMGHGLMGRPKPNG